MTQLRFAPPPMAREYQSLAIRQLEACLDCNPILVSPTGSGKTIMLVKLCRRLGLQVLWVAHRRELITQAQEHLEAIGFGDFIVTSIQKISRHSIPEGIGLIVIDECFPGGTMVDGKDIKYVKIGDIVTAWDHENNIAVKRKVIHKFVNDVHELVEVRMGEKKIICTPNHEFYIVNCDKYVQAKNIRKGDYVLRDMREKNNPKKRNKDLQKNMFGKMHANSKFGNDVNNKQKICFGADDKKQSNARRKNKKKSIRYIKTNWSQAMCSRRKWSRNDTTRTDIIGCNGIKAGQPHNRNGENKRRLSDTLQNRFRRQKNKTWNRNRRFFTLCIGTTKTRQKKTELFGIIRVDDIAVLKPRSRGGFENVCPDGKVYNIEVEEHNNYFANGILVHNCHHAIKDSQYQMLFDSGIPIVGATATPFRLDGRGLGDMFGKLVVAATPRQLVDEGYIQEPTIYSHPAPDMTGAKKIGGDWSKKETGRRSNKPKLLADIVSTWLRRAKGLKTLVFASTIKHSQSIIESFVEAGVPAEHLDGKTPKKERDSILNLLRTGETLIVSNVGIATEGFDLPALDCIIMARPTASLCLWLQMCGRVMRPEGMALILDHSGNALRHGSPTRPIQYTLEADQKQAVDVLGLKMCPGCLLMVKVGCTRCPDCGMDLSPVAHVMTKEANGELVLFEDKLAVWEQVGHDRDKYKAIFGEAPIVIKGKLMEASKENQRVIYEHYIRIAWNQEYKMNWAKMQYKRIYKKWPGRGLSNIINELMNEKYRNNRLGESNGNEYKQG